MIIATFFWALGHPLGRIIVRKIHPFQLGSVTLTTGFISIIIYMTFTGRLKSIFKLSVYDFLLSLLLGVFGFFLYQIFTFSALARIPASMNAILVATNVIFIALLAPIFLKEKISIYRTLGIPIAMAGAAFVIFNRGFTLDQNVALIGCLFSIFAAMTFALYSIFAKRILSRNDPIVVVAIALFSGAVLLIILSSFTVGLQPLLFSGARIWLLMVLLGCGMIGVSYPIWFACLKRMEATHISIYIYMTPVFAVILSLAILKETFLWPFWIGSALIIGGIIISNLSASTEKR